MRQATAGRPARVLVYFPDFSAIHIHKDISAIPYFGAVECGWDAAIAHFGGGVELPGDIGRRVRDVPLGNARTRPARLLRALTYVWREAPRLDALNLYHDSPEASLLAAVYKLRNPRGRVYMRLDMRADRARELAGARALSRASARTFLRHVLSTWAIDLFSAETEEVTAILHGHYRYRKRLACLPNGFFPAGDTFAPDEISLKENVLLTVGRIGTPDKDSELLLAALRALPKEALTGWDLLLVGPIEEWFRVELAAFLDSRRGLPPRIITTGPVTDREELYGLYGRSKIFLLTSRRESFGLVLLEAMYHGNYVVTSDVGAARDLLSGGGGAGSIIRPGDADALARELLRATSGDVDLAIAASTNHGLVKDNYLWANLVRRLDEILFLRKDHPSGGAGVPPERGTVLARGGGGRREEPTLGSSGRKGFKGGKMFHESPWANLRALRRLLRPQRVLYTKNAVPPQHAVAVGEFTYGSPRILDWGEGARVEIGKFCSIADNVTILLGGNHRMDWVTTYPFPAIKEWGAGGISGHPSTNGDVLIGNDVWIASHATILSGVRIGDGAVIGSYAVVTRDVDPYTVVAGNPAKAVKKLFEEETIRRLLETRWWEWPVSRIKENMHLLCSPDVEGLLSVAAVDKNS